MILSFSGLMGAFPDRNRIHASGIEIDVESAVVETAFAEQPPDQFEFGGCEPLIYEQLLNGK